LWVYGGTPLRYHPFPVLAAKAGILQLVGQWEQAQSIMSGNFEASKNWADKTFTAEARRQLASLLIHQGRYEQAAELAEGAYSYFKELYDIAGMLNSLEVLGQVCEFTGDYSAALEYYQKQFELAGKEDTYVAQALSNLGNLHKAAGRFELAGDFYQKLLKIAESTGQKKYLRAAYNNMGNILRSQGKLEEALEYMQKAREISAAMGDRWSGMAAMNNIGTIHSARLEYDKALECYYSLLESARILGDPRTAGIAIGNLGNTFLEKGDHAKAREFFYQRLEMARSLGDRKGQMFTLGNMGQSYLQTDDLAKARECFAKQLDLACQMGDVGNEAEARSKLGQVLLALGSPEESERECLLAVELGEKSGDQWYFCEYLIHLAEAQMVLKKYLQAGEIIKRAKVLSSKLERKNLSQHCLELEEKIKSVSL